MGETRVDLLHLLEDLRDAYSGPLEETILTEMVANALDSGATRLTLAAEPAQATLTMVDDGSGMTRRELTRYHDIAASTKVRGHGIGFAGVGIKLGLLACQEVMTETRRGTTHAASSWHLASRHRAPWRRVPPPGPVGERGTAVRLRLQNPLSPLLDPGFVEATVRSAFAPLFDPTFDEVLAPHYPRAIRFVINGQELARHEPSGDRGLLSIRLGRKRKPAAVGFLVRQPEPLGEERRGLAISTLGKVIRHGWDWLGLAPGSPEHVGGLVEAPMLAECLTLDKGDFIRAGRRGMTYLVVRKAMQEVVAAQFARWGDAHDAVADARRRKARPVERDLQAVLVDLADRFPLLTSLVERHAGGQRRLPTGSGSGSAGPGIGADGDAVPEAGAGHPGAVARAARLGGEDGTLGGRDPARDGEPDATPEGAPPPPPTPPSPADEPRAPVARLVAPAGRRGPRRPGHYGLAIQFASRPDDPELARLVESTVWVNEAHPAYRRALASRSEGYHLALSVAMALAPLAVESHDVHAFVTAFLARWGEAVAKDGRRRRGRPRG